jgi:hypothetical protein
VSGRCDAEGASGAWGEGATGQVRRTQALLKRGVVCVGTEQGQQLEDTGRNSSLVLIGKKRTQGEITRICREEAREPPPDLVEHRTIPYKVQRWVWKVPGQASYAFAVGGGHVECVVKRRGAEAKKSPNVR